MRIKADLHIHSALSPCGSLEMSPLAIVRRAKEIGLDLIAVTDHNAMANAFYAAALGQKLGLSVLYGMEAQTREDVHILCLFEQKQQAERFAVRIHDSLPDTANNPDYFGDQVIVDEEENVVGFEKKLLLNSLSLSLGELLELVAMHGGRVVPSHVECAPFGLMANLGLVPPELLGFVLEVSVRSTIEEATALYPQLGQFSLISNSDAHYPAEIGRIWTEYEVLALTLPALYQAALEKMHFIRRGNGGG